MYLKEVLLLRENIKSFNHYPYSIPAIKSMHQIEFKSNVTFFIGENGSGKSTLLEAIAHQCNFITERIFVLQLALEHTPAIPIK